MQLLRLITLLMDTTYVKLHTCTRAVWKVRGLALLLRVGTLWRCKRCTSYNAPPTSRKRAADRWSLRSFLPQSSLFMVGEAQKSHEARLGLYGECSNWDPLFPSRTQNSSQNSPHAISGHFQPWKGSSEARNFEVVNGLQHVFEKWVELCKKCIACQGRYLEKETVTAPPQSSDSE
jgi:hypothetical protein